MYQFTVTPTPKKVGDLRVYQFRVTEIAVQPASEWLIEDLPNLVTLVSFRSYLFDGDNAASFQPELGLKAAWTAGSLDHLTGQSTTTAVDTLINDFTRIPLFLPDGRIYGRSKPDDTAVGITTDLVLVAGVV
ncbi:MAG: hypothetical protein AAFR76_01460 [Planctomycetota bacterium]